MANENYYKRDDIPDITNIQGDAVFGLPKRAELFMFFRIKDVEKFKEDLKTKFKPTSALDLLNNLKAIEAAKATEANANVATQKQIAFSKRGLDTLQVLDNITTGDVHFEEGSMRQKKDILGDQSAWDGTFDNGNLDGVIILAARNMVKCNIEKDRVLADFHASLNIESTDIVIGHAREKAGLEKHEHFGYLDGVSQPAMRGVIEPYPGQIQVDPGVLLMGYEGDPVPNRPKWTKDGTMLVFRKLEQDVVGLERYSAKSAKEWKKSNPKDDKGKELTEDELKDLFEARFFGRWKSGAPLEKSPFRDNKAMARDPERNNNFDYTAHGETMPSDARCPFNAHIRKTAPRNLSPFIDRKYLESASIVRAGIAYGPEVTEDERSNYDPKALSPRGLLFVCYSSSLDHGFVRQTVDYGNNDFFPITSLMPIDHGQDPIIGGPPAKDTQQVAREVKVVKHEFKVLETDKNDQGENFQDGAHVNLRIMDDDGAQIAEVTGLAQVKKPLGADNPFFVTSRGGEYFFVPSISVLKRWAEGWVAWE